MEIVEKSHSNVQLTIYLNLNPNNLYFTVVHGWLMMVDGQLITALLCRLQFLTGFFIIKWW